MKTCGITGHGKINDIDYARKILRYEIILALLDGYTNFISGMADVIDMEFAGLIAEVKKSMPSVTLEAAIPYRSKLTERKTPRFQELLGKCDKITVTGEERIRGCYRIRNRYIAEKSDRIIAVLHGRNAWRAHRGGTAQILRIARENKREIKSFRI